MRRRTTTQLVGLVSAWMLVVSGARASAQSRPSGTLDGFVSDTMLTPLASATVSVLGSSIRVTTGANGRFRIVDLPAGSHLIMVRRIGYAPIAAAIDIVGRDTLRSSFMLRNVATALDTVVVTESATSRLSEFEARRRLGFGHFLNQSDIDTRHAVSVADLVRVIPSVVIEERALWQQYAVNARDGCAFKVFVDGVPLPSPTNLVDVPRPVEIAGIEVYSGPATIPPMYAALGGTCGVILLWTKGD